MKTSPWTLLALGSLIYGFAPASPSASKSPNPIYLKGLSAWRKPGRIDHAACANCHGPDGLELAVYKFDDKTLIRRSLPHLSSADSAQIVNLIHEVRKQYRIENLLDPLVDRPFQPGGFVLPGKTPSQRDYRFGLELKSLLPSLAKGRITSLGQARNAAKEILAVDPWKLPIGVPFNRFSEDKFHGPEHASLAHWIPDVPRTIPSENRRQFFALQDRYLQNPSDANLWMMVNGLKSLTVVASDSSLAHMAEDKMIALLLLQHRLRLEHLGHAFKSQPIAFISTPGAMLSGGYAQKNLLANPAWEVGELARRQHEEGLLATGANSRIVALKTGGPSFESQMLDMQASWLWLGWLFDQGLNRTTHNVMSSRGDWLAIALWNSGPYAIHNAFWLARKQLIANEIPESWAGLPSRRKPEWDYLALQVGGRYRTSMPSDAKHRELYCRFLDNCFRMSLYLVLDQWNRTHEVWFKHACQEHVRALTTFIHDTDPAADQETDELREKLNKAIDAAVERT